MYYYPHECVIVTTPTSIHASILLKVTVHSTVIYYSDILHNFFLDHACPPLYQCTVMSPK